MGHMDRVPKLGRTKSHREAMLANMAISLFTHRLIKTTDSRAKALRPLVDKLITMAKKNTLASKREVAKTVHVREAFQKLYAEILPQFENRQSGFTRVIKLGVRRGDGAPMSVVELLTAKPVEQPKEEKKEKKGLSGLSLKRSPKKTPAKKKVTAPPKKKKAGAKA